MLPDTNTTRPTSIPANTYDVLKLIAIVTMIIDHVGHYFAPDNGWLRVIGRVAFPLFLFLVGYSRNVRWSWRVLVGGVLVTGIRVFGGDGLFPLNILFTILLARWYIGADPRFRQWVHPVLLAALWLFTAPVVEYGTMGILYALWGRRVRDKGASVRIWLEGFVLTFFHALTQWWGLGQLDVTFASEVLTLVPIVVFALYPLLTRFTLRDVFLPAFLVWVSRHALDVYVIHLAVFALIAHVLRT